MESNQLHSPCRVPAITRWNCVSPCFQETYENHRRATKFLGVATGQQDCPWLTTINLATPCTYAAKDRVEVTAALRQQSVAFWHHRCVVVDSGRETLAGQHSKSMGTQIAPNCLTLNPLGQTLSRRHWGVLIVVFCLCVVMAANVRGQLVDPLDAYPPRWHLGFSDCQARLTNHVNEPTSGVGGSGCESVSIHAASGTQAILEYRIEPTRVIDELTARVFIKSSQIGQSIGLRVRFPLVIDPATGQSVAVTVWGAKYRDAGQWQMLGIGAIEKQLRLKSYALRRQYGTDANFGDTFVDAVVINAYTGPGETTILIDNLAIDSMVSVSSMRDFADQRNKTGPGQLASERFDTGSVTRASPALGAQSQVNPFGPGKVWKILQHQGEPLQWVKTLGFDAILLPRPPDHLLLSEAIRSGVKIISPPPTAPDPNLTPLLEPLAGYYLGTSLASGNLAAAVDFSDKIARWPLAWQRPIIIAPAESFRQYSAIASSLVHDLPPAVRGLTGPEEIAVLSDRLKRSGRTQLDLVGVQTDAPESLKRQLDAITTSIGSPRGEDLFWHSLLLQVARSLELSPRAILFRSNRSLTSGTSEAQHRSLALSYVNRYIDSIASLVSVGIATSALPTNGPPFHNSRLDFPGGQLLILTTTAQRQAMALAGDGVALRISLPPSDSPKIAWRLTHFTAERMTVETTSSGVHLEVVSPDVVETIVLSNDPALGGRIARALQPLAGQAAGDRWQMTRDATQQVSDDWRLATSARLVPVSASALDMLRAAQSTLRDAEPLFRGGDSGATLRMARRADAWAMKARWQLANALADANQSSALNSCPPLLAVGGTAAQVMWSPLMGEAGWSENLLLGGALDSNELLGEAGWTVGKRPDFDTIARSDVSIVAGPQAEGAACLVANVTTLHGEPLPGGYAGTMLQIRSPAVRFAAKTPIRIDLKVKTLGFGGPDQGVLVYENVGGPELGVLVRATPQWQNVTLYRQTLTDGEVNVILELIGAGEVAVDDVRVRYWTANPTSPLPFRQISQATRDTTLPSREGRTR